MKKGDLVKTIQGWAGKSRYGIIITLRGFDVKVFWAEAHPFYGQIFWAPYHKLECVNEEG